MPSRSNAFIKRGAAIVAKKSIQVSAGVVAPKTSTIADNGQGSVSTSLGVAPHEEVAAVWRESGGSSRDWRGAWSWPDVFVGGTAPRYEIEQRLERLVDPVLAEQPLRRAAVSLERRVMAELKRGARLPDELHDARSWPKDVISERLSSKALR